MNDAAFVSKWLRKFKLTGILITTATVIENTIKF